MDEGYTIPKAIRRSDRLHERVRAFAQLSERARPSLAQGTDTFESLALDIARFQYDYSPGFARLLADRQGRLETLEDLPWVPTDAFRYCRVAVHPAELDHVVFQTSGTTADPGRHPVRTLETKETLALIQAKQTLFAKERRGIIVALAPVPGDPGDSSLAHMMGLFMRHCDGRSLTPDPEGAVFDFRASERWLLGPGGVEVEALHRAARLAIHRSEPLFILSTSFALLSLLEELDGSQIRTPARTTIMLTGGFKGVKSKIDEAELRRLASRAFDVEPVRIVGEYGMTELSSQLFEDPDTGKYVAPAWCRVRALDPVTHETQPDGTPGLAHFIDLANVDSCLSVLTQDLVRITDGRVELLGRAPRAVPRGCSLPYEGLIAGGRR